ncbi:MAG: hypothetical protein JW966_00685 [Anaerolineae bacterium]|nr:hypothetical protein [Anaerolineae bacterium]
MKIHYTLDNSAARLPLAIRSAEGVWDRHAELRNAPGIHLVELTTQHMMGTGATLADELSYFFDHEEPSELDPYNLAHCYAHQDQFSDLLRDLLDNETGLVALDEVEALFPASYDRELNFMLAVAVVGFPAFGCVRTYKDSEGDEYHGIVVNLAQAHPHLINYLGNFSLSLLTDTIRYGLFNHQGFKLAYTDFCDTIDRVPEKPLERLLDTLLVRGIAWYVGYCHDLPFFDALLQLDEAAMVACVTGWNQLVEEARGQSWTEDTYADWLHGHRDELDSERCLDVAGYTAARTIAGQHGIKGLQDAIVEGPLHFVEQYNLLAQHPLTV